MASSDERPGRRSKVERVIEEYDLSGLGETLARYWTREEDRYSLRSLADLLNTEVLRSAMESAGMRPLDGEVENTYRLLSDSSVSRGARHQAERVLQREGIDAEELERDFVSHQAVHTYLRERRGISHTPGHAAEDRREKARETIDRLQSRAEAVTANLLSGLADDGELPFEEFDVLVNLRVLDRTTGRAYDVDELLAEIRAEPPESE